jgi:threonyl-tRNA synthetase
LELLADSEDASWNYWDTTRPLEGDCHLTLHKFDESLGKETFWHSSAHVLGEALESDYGCHLCHGPPTESGFFYDSYTGKKDIFTEKNYKEIEKTAQKFIAEKQTFSRLVLAKEEALKLFAANPFKT